MKANNLQLAKSLLKTGKVKSWIEYAKEFNMTPDAARMVWVKLRYDKDFNTEVWKSVEEDNVKIGMLQVKPVTYGNPESRLNKGNDFQELLKRAIANAEEREHLQEIDDQNHVNNYIAALENKVIEFTESPKDNTAKKVVETIEEVQTLEDLIRICKIDTEIWDITRYSQKSSNGKYTVEAFMSKKEEPVEDTLRKTLLEEIIAYHEGKDQLVDLTKDLSFQPLPETHRKKDQLLELAIFDLHLGKFSWKGETGEDYDMSIAIKRYKECIKELLDRVDLSRIDRILLPLGNDMLHIDNKQKTTTGGTPQDTDTRFAKIVRTAKNLMVETIEELSLIAPVDVMIIPGNHDQTVMFTLGEILEAFFYNNEDVNIYNDPKLRKYYKYGQNMIMFTHGSEEKHQDLGLIAATEAPTIWANTKYREVHLGHLHKSKSVKYTNVDEYQGFKIRIINSLSGTDAWHYSKGYMSLKGAEAFVWDYEKGLITNHFYNL